MREMMSMNYSYTESRYMPNDDYEMKANTRKTPVYEVCKRTLPSLCIVIPCYNEEAVLPRMAPVFLSELDSLEASNLISKGSLLFVDDGSSDQTWSKICSLAEADSRILGIKLSRNFGHQRALLAGYMNALSLSFDAVVSIDCDGQDDPSAIPEMVKRYSEGCEVVYGVRSSRKTDTRFKRFTAESFYRLLNAMGVEAVFNHADYRLLSARALKALSEFEEANIFLRGMVPLLGFSSDIVEYERHERIAGNSHYSLKKMISLAINGITSLSVAPIRIISGIGLTLFILSIIGIIWTIAVVATDNAVPGWASLLCVVLLLSGLQLFALGVIGEYIGRIYIESKHRPHYIIEDRTNLNALSD